MLILYLLFFVLTSTLAYMRTRSVLILIYVSSVFIPFLFIVFEIPGVYFVLPLIIILWGGYKLTLNDETPGHSTIRMKKTTYFFMILAILISFLTSSVASINGIDWIIRTIPAFILFFVASQIVLDDDSFSKAQSLFFYCWWIQVILNLGWRFGINPFPNNWINDAMDDYATGTMGYVVDCSDFMVLGILYVFPLVIYLQEKRIKYGITLLIFIIMYVEAQTRHTMPIVLIAVAIQLLLAIRKHIQWKYVFRYISVFLLLIAFVYVAALKGIYTSSDYKLDLSIDDALKVSTEMYQDRVGESFKLLNNAIMADYMMESPTVRFFFGYGPGSFASYIGIRAETELSTSILLYPNLNGRGESVLDLPSSGFFGIWTELGFIGLVSVYGSVLYFLVQVSRKLKDGINQKIEIESSRIIGILVFLFALSFIRDFFTYYQFIEACILLGISFGRIRLHEKLSGNGLS